MRAYEWITESCAQSIYSKTESFIVEFAAGITPLQCHVHDLVIWKCLVISNVINICAANIFIETLIHLFRIN